MRNRYAGLLCVVGLSMVAVGCYNNPDLASRPPGSGVKDIHSGPQVGPGTTAGGATAGPQPAAKAGHLNVEPTHGGATADSPSLDRAGAATPEKHEAPQPPAKASQKR
jgi:hypothetical protein